MVAARTSCGCAPRAACQPSYRLGPPGSVAVMGSCVPVATIPIVMRTQLVIVVGRTGVSRQPWILSGTVRSRIVDPVVSCCAR